MISGLFDVAPSPKTNIIHLWRPQETSKVPRTSQTIFEKLLFFYEYQHSGNYVLEMFEKTGAENLADLFNKILKILDMRSISIKQHEMEIW